MGKIKVLSFPSPHTHTFFFSLLIHSFIDPIYIQIKPKVGTVCFGVAASQGTLLLAGGEKGMRYSMPNARIMLNQPQCGFEVRIKLLKKKKLILIWCWKRIITQPMVPRLIILGSSIGIVPSSI